MQVGWNVGRETRSQLPEGLEASRYFQLSLRYGIVG